MYIHFSMADGGVKMLEIIMTARRLLDNRGIQLLHGGSYAWFSTRVKGVQFDLTETEMSPMPMMMAEAIMINVLFQIIQITIKKMSGENLINTDDVDTLGQEDKD